MRIRRFILALVLVDLLLFAGVCFAQEQPAAGKEDRVHEVLNNFMASDSYHKYKNKRYPEAKGTLVLTLVVKGKKVETVTTDDSNVTPVPFVNAFENYIKDMTFDFKLPKGQRMKLQHTFIIQ